MGFPHPDYLYPYLSAGQLSDWITFSSQHGLGPWRNDRYWANLLCMTYNVNRGEKEAALTPDQFNLYKPADDDYDDDEAFLASVQAFSGKMQILNNRK